MLPGSMIIGRRHPIVKLTQQGSEIDISSFCTGETLALPEDIAAQLGGKASHLCTPLAYHLADDQKREKQYHGPGVPQPVLLYPLGYARRLKMTQNHCHLMISVKVLQDWAKDNKRKRKGSSGRNGREKSRKGGDSHRNRGRSLSDSEIDVGSNRIGKIASWCIARRRNALDRDFTINSMMYDPFSRIVFDYTSGFKHCR